MRIRGWLVVSLVTACTPAPVVPVTQRAGLISVPPPRPEPPSVPAEPIALRRSRRGECNLAKALDAFLLGQEATNCGELSSMPADVDYERARACVIEAQRARKAFKIVWGGPAIDSIMLEAIAGRDVGDGYEVRWFSYDSCPSGCGHDDPSWDSVRCASVVDLRAACRALQQQKKVGDDDLRWLCESGDERKMRRRLELRCNGRGDPRVCGPEQ